MDRLTFIFIKKEIQSRQKDQDSRCHQYDLALQREAPDPVLVYSDIAPDEKADASLIISINMLIFILMSRILKARQ